MAMVTAVVEKAAFDVNGQISCNEAAEVMQRIEDRPVLKSTGQTSVPMHPGSTAVLKRKRGRPHGGEHSALAQNFTDVMQMTVFTEATAQSPSALCGPPLELFMLCGPAGVSVKKEQDRKASAVASINLVRALDRDGLALCAA